MDNIMDQHTRTIYKNRIIDLEHQLQQVNKERTALIGTRKYQISKERMLAFRYHLKYRQLEDARYALDYVPPRKEPAWVRKHTEDSIVQYIATGE